MKRIVRWWVVLAGLALPLATAQAAEVMKTEKSSMNVNGRLQLIGFGQSVDDASRADQRLYMFVRQARLGLSGDYDGYKYKLQLGFAGEEEVKAPSPGVGLSLQDLYFDVPVRVAPGQVWVRVGQHKIPYSRERLLDAGNLSFADRSLNNLGFRVGREIGVTAATTQGKLAGAVGMYTGGGRDVPERYLPQVLGSPMFVGRFGYENGYDEDVFAASRAPASGVGTAFFVNGLYVRDSLVGHSSVMNVRMSERPLLLNTNWNPYLPQAPLRQGDFWQAGADAAVRVPVGAAFVSGELEANYGSYANPYGRVSLFGGRAQVGAQWKAFEVNARYAMLKPDESFSTGGKQTSGAGAMHEITPGVGYTFEGGWAKLVADLPVLIDMPVATENNLGAYVIAEHPDQVSVLKNGGTVTRQNVVEGRLMLQATF